MPSRRHAGNSAPSSDERLKPPASDAGDFAHALAKSVVSGVPVIGPAASELFGLILAPSYQQRLATWMNEVADRILGLEVEHQGLRARLAENQAFLTTAAQAAQAVGRNHQAEKLGALRNAVLNSALLTEPDDSVQQVFVALVDRFTAWHLITLKFFDDPRTWYAKHSLPTPNVIMGGIDQIFEPAVPGLFKQGGLKDQVTRDLRDSGLADIPSGMMSGNGLWEPRTSPWGKRFLKFIEDPAE